MESFPSDTIFAIVYHSDVKEILILDLVSKSFHKIVSSEYLWFLQVQKFGITDYPKIPSNHRRIFYGEPGWNTNVVLADEMNISGYWWRKHFFNYYCVHLASLHLDTIKLHWDDTWKKGLPAKKCDICPSGPIWVCLTCNFSGCGRQQLSHALEHYHSKNHALAVNPTDLDLWCYKCERFIKNSTYKERQLVTGLNIVFFSDNIRNHSSELGFISFRREGKLYCKFCRQAGLHVQCILEDEDRRKLLYKNW
eukprot:TRINITY_DN11120_c0_g1_i1.p1 TRINITY_DN11120_c0_g1~~TRINITY_DN11120_c0_g1_i1.p1  ORF type:complete len:251 (+),score=47.83 TRINITY_DN11120_c0_g1_i1:33-785(+)